MVCHFGRLCGISSLTVCVLFFYVSLLLSLPLLLRISPFTYLFFYGFFYGLCGMSGISSSLFYVIFFVGAFAVVDYLLLVLSVVLVLPGS